MIEACSDLRVDIVIANDVETTQNCAIMRLR